MLYALPRARLSAGVRMAENKRERSRGYPQYSLQDCLDALRQIVEALGSGPFTRDSVAVGMGMSPGSGAANSKAAALVHFGLLSRSAGAYSITELASTYLHPRAEPERDHATSIAATQPALFAEIFDRFQGKALPSMLPNILTRDMGIVAKQSEDAAKLFIRSAEYAGLLRNGILSSPAEAGAGPKPGPTMKADASPPPDKVTGDSSQSTQAVSTNAGFSIPLSKGRSATLHVPRSLADSDVHRIIQWIELMREVLIEEDGQETTNLEEGDIPADTD